MVEDDYSIIPLLNVNTRTLTKIIEYMKKHADAKMNLSEEDIKNFEKMDLNEKVIKNLEDIKNFDKEFVNTNSKNLFEVVFAANYLNIKGLFEFLCQTIADRIKNKSVKAVRKIFNVTNDFTEEEEAKVYEENKWAHEGERDELLISLCL
ncbi:skp1-like protein 1b [Nicotiana attenuata]|uniref:SKP1-like protein n=2 Tax=Nicotiana attenuata TaxID=49451 RepID=A0A314KJP6_NICAT|nr:skp1-like protein 1b [Nicotiana attenuata]